MKHFRILVFIVYTLLVFSLVSCTNNNDDESESLPSYTVSFYTNGGSQVASQIVKSGSFASRPNNPTRDGYTFEGWYSDSKLTNYFSFSTAITSDIILYAKWSEDSIYATVSVTKGSDIYSLTSEETDTGITLTVSTDLNVSLYNFCIDGQSVSTYSWASASENELIIDTSSWATGACYEVTVFSIVNSIVYSSTALVTK